LYGLEIRIDPISEEEVGFFVYFRKVIEAHKEEGRRVQILEGDRLFIIDLRSPRRFQCK
jgi:hypothetical protein